MGKSILSVYLDDNIKNLINKDVAERNLNNLGEKRVKVSNIIENIIMDYYSKKLNKKSVVTIGR